MKKYLLIFALPLLVLLSSCEKKAKVTYTNPVYTTSFRHVPDSVKSDVIVTYDAKKKVQFVETSEYDTQGRLVKLTNADADGNEIVVSWNYDSKGRISEFTNSAVPELKYTNTYNQKGQLIEEKFVDLVDADGFEHGCYYEFEYDQDGNVTAFNTMYIESEGIFEEYEYENGILSREIVYELNDSLVRDYNEQGLLVEQRNFNFDDLDNFDNAKPVSTINFTYDFDDKGQWTTRTAKEKKRVKNIEQRTIVYYAPEDFVVEPMTAPADDSIVSNYIYDVKDRDSREIDNPVLLWILIGLTCIFAILVIVYLYSEKKWFKNFGGQYQSNGMKRLWMYNKEPYIKVSVIVPVLISALLTSIILLFLFGGLTWLLLWILKIIMWIIIIVGWICLVTGILGLLARSGYGCLLVIVGGIIVAAQDWVKVTGDKMVEWGFNFLNELNLFGWGADLFSNYWDIILGFFVLPLLIFLTIAAVLIVLDMLLIAFEWVVTKIYSIRRPCSTCGDTGTPDYLVKGQKHPVNLRPGLYGVFSQRSPVTGENLPTMLFNGRGKVTRRCRNCGNIINAETEQTFGTEKHIGIVGNRSSGKSYLLYHGLGLLMDKYPDRLSQIDVDNETNIEKKHQRIRRREDIQTNMSKFYRAVQLIMKRKLQPVPYHLFFYDVAGEQFNVASMSNKSAMDFYRHVESIAFVIDPSMLDVSGKAIGSDFRKWYEQNANPEKYDTEGTLAVLQDILERADNSSRKININFVLTKSDTGYLTACGYAASLSPEDVERFMLEQLGLGNLVNTARSAFKEVGFFAVNVNDSDESDVYELFETMLAQRGVKF